MVTYRALSSQPQTFQALTGLSSAEFRRLLPAFRAAYDQAHPPDRAADGRPPQRWPGAGRRAALADKLLFILVYLKTYPVQAVLGQLFGLSTAQANYWLHHLLPIVRAALDDPGVLPERDSARIARQIDQPLHAPVLIIDGTERRRQRPKKAEEQAAHYSGKKKAHADKNVLVVSGTSERVVFLSATYPGTANDKRIADEACLEYPPGTTLYKDAGFQGYEPPVARTRQEKKAAGRRAERSRAGEQPQAGAGSRSRGARHRRR